MDKDLLLEEIQSNSKGNPNFETNNLQLHSLSLVSRYNLFVRCYNTTCNRIDEKTLMFIPESKIFNTFTSVIFDTKLYVLFMFCFLIPFVNLFLLCYFSIVLVQYFRGLRVYRKNQKRVENPLKNMKFDPQKCSQLRRNFHFMTLNFKNLRKDFNFKENTQLTKSQGKQGTKSEWMIYNMEFSSYYHDYPKGKIKFIVSFVCGVALSFGSTFSIIAMI